AVFAALAAAGPFAAGVIAQSSGRSADHGYRPACKTCNSTTEEQPPTSTTSTTSTTMTTGPPPPPTTVTPPTTPEKAVTAEDKSEARQLIHELVRGVAAACASYLELATSGFGNPVMSYFGSVYLTKLVAGL